VLEAFVRDEGDVSMGQGVFIPRLLIRWRALRDPLSGDSVARRLFAERESTCGGTAPTNSEPQRDERAQIALLFSIPAASGQLAFDSRSDTCLPGQNASDIILNRARISIRQDREVDRLKFVENSLK
jgi:hypothetical protein